MDWPTRSRVSDRKKPWYAAVFTVPPEGLNARSPHRYSPIYRPEGEMVRNLYLFDTLGTVSADPSPVSMGDTFCQFVGASSIFSTGNPLEDARLDGHPNGKSSSRALACHCFETQGPYSEVSAISTHFRNQSLMTKFPS